MHSDLYVFKKKGETIDEGALLEGFDKASPMGADSLGLMTDDEKALKAYRDSVTKLKPAVEYLNRVRDGILKIAERFNPDTALNSDEYDYRIDTLFESIDDCKGDWFAISRGNGEFTFLRRVDLAMNTASHNGYYASLVKDMDLVLYDYHY